MRNPAATNRMAVVLLPTEAYLAWTMTCPGASPNTTLERLRDEASVYLLPQTDGDLEKHVRRHFKPMLLEELFAWCTDESYWPPDLSYRTFKKFFDVQLASLVFDLGICCDMMHGFDWSLWMTGTPAQRLGLLPPAQEHILQQEDGKPRFTKAVTDLSRAFALCAAHDEAIRIRDDLSFFQAVKSALTKSGGPRRSQEDLDHAVRQLISKAVTASDEVIDVFTAAGLDKPDISILSDEFLAEVRGLKHKNVAAELLEKLLKDEIRCRAQRNVVQSRAFSERLKATMNAYHNRAIATHEIIEELIQLAKEMREAAKRGEDLGLEDDELAFYDALAQNESAIQAMGIDELKVIAAELVTKVRQSVSIDWTVRESARAKIRVMVRRILRKHGYPPDLQAEATKLVLEQAETLCADWAG